MFLSSFLTTALRTEHQKQGARSKKAALLVRAAIPTGQGNVADASVVPHADINVQLKVQKEGFKSPNSSLLPLRAKINKRDEGLEGWFSS